MYYRSELLRTSRYKLVYSHDLCLVVMEMHVLEAMHVLKLQNTVPCACVAFNLLYLPLV